MRTGPASQLLPVSSVGPHLIAFGQTELTGNIWLAGPAKKDAH